MKQASRPSRSALRVCARALLVAWCAGAPLAPATGAPPDGSPASASPPPSPAPGAGAGDENPALQKFGAAIAFYLSFDRGTAADMAGGKPAPIETEGKPDLHPGLWGKSLLMSGAGQTHLCYDTADNIVTARPVALA